ncbi:Cell division coordinator CpoB [Olavius algarvensis associated proteobacterium Delta 3]|nr:Cell division coordinator CpoB [Olavius algarvensis associated proteobacterium Delta 3]
MKYAAIVLMIAAFGMIGCVGDDQYAGLDGRLFRLEEQQQDMERRFDRLEQGYRKIDASRQEIDTDVQTLRTQLAEFRVENDNLRNELGGLRGRLEETEYAVRAKEDTISETGVALATQVGRLDESVVAHDERIRRLEEYLSLDLAGAPPSDMPVTPPGEVSEDDLYRYAKVAFDAGDMETARSGFSDYLKRFPKSQRADNAQFWIAEIYFREKWFEKAILEYQKVIEGYPKGNKVPAAMLKQGMAFSNLGDRSNARLILRELVAKYPKAGEAEIARKKLKGL